jgi:translation initiation factor 2 subunit 3
MSSSDIITNNILQTELKPGQIVRTSESNTHQLSLQPTINCGLLGSVAHGKSSLIKALINTITQRFGEEKKRNLTINMGYANMKVWSSMSKLFATSSTVTDQEDAELVGHYSWVDCPGHQEYINTMLSSICLMDGAIVVVAVDQTISKCPQLIQHLAAAKLGGLTKIIIALNKIDLVSKQVVLERKKELDILLEQYQIVPYAIIPTSFSKNVGTDMLLKAMHQMFTSENHLDQTIKPPCLLISRTFDINKPGTDWTQVKGGVLGGSLVGGTLAVGDVIELRPGLISTDGKKTSKPIRTHIISIQSDETVLSSAVPGGLIAIQTDIDPFYTKGNKLIGNIVGKVGELPPVYKLITLNVNIVNYFGTTWRPMINDKVLLQLDTRTVNATLVNTMGNYTFELDKPACVYPTQKIIICKSVSSNSKLVNIVGEGTIDHTFKQTPLYE